MQDNTPQFVSKSGGVKKLPKKPDHRGSQHRVCSPQNMRKVGFGTGSVESRATNCPWRIMMCLSDRQRETNACVDDYDDK